MDGRFVVGDPTKGGGRKVVRGKGEKDVREEMVRMER
jgi:hypothetical protein